VRGGKARQGKAIEKGSFSTDLLQIFSALSFWIYSGIGWVCKGEELVVDAK
jgi:hypothetical protein